MAFAFISVFLTDSQLSMQLPNQLFERSLFFSLPLSLFPNLVYGCCCCFFPPRWSKINQPICHPPLPPLPLSSPPPVYLPAAYYPSPLSVMLSVSSTCFHLRVAAISLANIQPANAEFLDADSQGSHAQTSGKKKIVNGGVNTEEKHRFRSNLVLH